MFIGLIIGAMIPYLCSSLSMGSVKEVVYEVILSTKDELTNLRENPATADQLPSQTNFINNLAKFSLQVILIPGLIIIMVPIFFGVFFGVTAVAGILMGITISGLQLAISMINSGSSWRSTKKSILEKGITVDGLELLRLELSGRKKKLEADALRKEELEKPERQRSAEDEIEYQNINKEDATSAKRNAELNEAIENIASDEDHSERKELYHIYNSTFDENTLAVELAEDLDRKIIKGECYNDFYYNCLEGAEVGDNVGSLMKDLNGPTMNILIKLASMSSVVFAALFTKTNIFGGK